METTLPSPEKSMFLTMTAQWEVTREVSTRSRNALYERVLHIRSCLWTHCRISRDEVTSSATYLSSLVFYQTSTHGLHSAFDLFLVTKL